MNLARLYSQLIGTCEERNGKPLYQYTNAPRNRREGFEIHHITPRSTKKHWFKNINDPMNLVYMTPREHYIAHHILARLYGGRLAIAFFQMSTDKGRGLNITSRQYETAKFLFLQFARNRKHSEEHKAKLREVMKTRVFTDTHKTRLSEAAKARDPISCPHCGKSGDMRNMKRWHFDNCAVITGKGRSAEIISCPHCGKTGKRSHVTRYHFDNCKHKPA